MKNKKCFAIATIILAVLAAVIGGYITYDKFIETDYDDVKGLYTYTSETKLDEFGNEFAALYYLCLEENGTFSYKMGTGAICGHIGNYIIQDNTILLNYLFRTDNGTGLYATTGSKTIKIVGKDKLLDVDPTVTVGDMKDVLLKKASSAEENEHLKYSNISHLLNNYDIVNNASNNQMR